MRHILAGITRLRETHPVDDAADAEGMEAPELGIPVLADEDWKRGPLAGRVPWARAEEKMVFRREKKARVVTAAELTLPEPLLARLRGEARGMTRWVKAKKAGVTQDVVDEIRRAWRRGELAMVKIVAPLCRNMDRAREIIEAKTGGLVVWSKKDILVVYRGSDYHLTAKDFHSSAACGEPSSSEFVSEDCTAIFPAKIDGIKDGSVALKDREAECSQPIDVDWEVRKRVEFTETLYEREANRLLDGLGPRFIDWWWRKPLPVDADLLPEVVPGFTTPFRLCPPRVRQKLTDDELTYLRKLAHPLPTHFALGKNTRLQGLAAAIIKLWEKSLLAKIAVKLGIPNTNHQQMSSELKRLTGGVLILSNKFYIVLYRGKDFLPGRVANSILEREKFLHNQQLQEEEARLKAIKSFHVTDESELGTTTIGTFAEFQDIQDNYAPLNNGISEVKVQIEAEKENLEKELREQERRLLILKKKIEKSEKDLAELDSSWSTSEQGADQELLTEEERQTFQKIGSKMDEVLLLGRRGIYDGVIGSIHQHWKHREVVKIITMQKSLQQVIHCAKLLEIESGGILVAVEKLRKGHAIIIYRGKNYARPLKLLPENLLTKRRALQRSIEIQRRGSLKFFAYQREQRIWELKQRLRDGEQRAKELISRESQDLSLKY